MLPNANLKFFANRLFPATQLAAWEVSNGLELGTWFNGSSRRGFGQEEKTSQRTTEPLRIKCHIMSYPSAEAV
jgi:hypothetical protein